MFLFIRVAVAKVSLHSNENLTKTPALVSFSFCPLRRDGPTSPAGSQSASSATPRTNTSDQDMLKAGPALQLLAKPGSFLKFDDFNGDCLIPVENPVCLTNGPGFEPLLNFHQAELAESTVTIQGFVLS